MAVLADHVKNLDWQVRRAVFEVKAPVEIVTDVSRAFTRVVVDFEWAWRSGQSLDNSLPNTS